jgi:hypothetical protein
MALTEVRTQPSISNIPLRRYEDRAGIMSFSRISWASVFAGSVIGLTLQLWLSMLGVAVGASTVDPLREAAPLAGMGVGSAVWLGVSIIISSFIGGWVAGRFAGTGGRGDAAVHGAASWAVSNIAAFLLVGTVLGGMVSGIAGTTKTVAETAGRAATGTAQQNPGVVDQAMDAARNAINRGQQAVQSGQADNTVRQVGDKAASAVAKTGWGIVTLMFLGLLSGLFGASAARPMNSSLNRDAA